MRQESEARHILATHFGDTTAAEALRYFGSMVERSRRFPWLRHALEDDAGLRGDLILDAAGELVLLALTDPDDCAQYGPNLLGAWKRAVATAWRDHRSLRGTGTPVLVLDGLEHEEEQPEPFPTEGLEEVLFDCLAPEHREVLAVMSVGFPMAEAARILGLSHATATARYRRAVGSLLANNPGLAARFGVVPCDQHDPGPSGYCSRCRLFGWVYADGATLVGGRGR
jgi:hypothetical protein